MADVRSGKCAQTNCIVRASYGVAGTRKAQYCRQHSKEDMIDIYNRRCAQSECNKRPSYGVIGTGKMEYCAQHAREGMADVRSGKCAQTTCNVRASYGVDGTRKAEYCRRHAKDGMVGVPKKRCTLKNCNEWASLAMAGSRMVYKCGRHLSNGTTNVFDEVLYVNDIKQPWFVVDRNMESLCPRGSKRKNAGHSLTGENKDSSKKTRIFTKNGTLSNPNVHRESGAGNESALPSDEQGSSFDRYTPIKAEIHFSF